MLEYILDKSKHPKYDHVEVNLQLRNDRDRVPFHLIFTPPTATYCGVNNGIDQNGDALTKLPDDLDMLADWIKPGSSQSREAMANLLIDKGQNIHVKACHVFLH
jgi:hypothetical protein